MNPLLGLGLLAATVAWLFSDNKESKMPAVQKQFEEFHANIKLDEDNEKAKLRQKRETLLKTLRENLEDDVPPFENFNQGSYSMHTGVLPLDGNYDIDVGLVFECKQDKYPDPVVLKKKVRDALNSNGRTVLIRRPCVTVNYKHEALARERWQAQSSTLAYLGLWHTHPEKDPTPSSVDHRDWQNAVANDTFEGEHLFFPIIGTHRIRVWCLTRNEPIRELIEEIRHV